MRVLDSATFIEAHPQNFNPSPRASAKIKFIVCHYTGNFNDTARSNTIYFHNNYVGASAHYFVSEESIYQSVRDQYPAYSVGLGSRKEPWIKNPSMFKTITNSNSISVELCGQKNDREASDTTKHTAAKLVVDLLEKYKLTPMSVYRHYDVTGKRCPAWAVDDPLKWFEFMLLVNTYFRGEGVDDILLNTEENYKVFKEFMDRYNREVAERPSDWSVEAMQYCQSRGLITTGRPDSPVTRAELATVLMRMNA